MPTSQIELPDILVWRRDGTTGFDRPESWAMLDQILGQHVSELDLEDFGFRHKHGISFVFGKLVDTAASSPFFEMDVVDMMHSGQSDRYAFVRYKGKQEGFVLVSQDNRELPMEAAIASPEMINYYSKPEHKALFEKTFPFAQL